MLRKVSCFALLAILGLVVTGCASLDENLGANAQISDCGGFDTTPKGFRLQQEGDDQCRDERLIWQYDRGSQTVSFLNKNVWLNCCGQHSIAITLNEEEDIYVIDETDKPEFGDARCGCRRLL